MILASLGSRIPALDSDTSFICRMTQTLVILSLLNLRTAHLEYLPMTIGLPVFAILIGISLLYYRFVTTGLDLELDAAGMSVPGRLTPKRWPSMKRVAAPGAARSTSPWSPVLIKEEPLPVPRPSSRRALPVWSWPPGIRTRVFRERGFRYSARAGYPLKQAFAQKKPFA